MGDALFSLEVLALHAEVPSRLLATAKVSTSHREAPSAPHFPQAVTFRLLDFPLVVVKRAPAKPAPESHNGTTDIDFDCGKSCLFRANPSELEAQLRENPLYAMLVDVRSPRRPRLLCMGLVPLSVHYSQGYSRDRVPLYSPMGQPRGSLGVCVRLTCHGPSLLSHLGTPGPLVARPAGTGGEHSPRGQPPAAAEGRQGLKQSGAAGRGPVEPWSAEQTPQPRRQPADQRAAAPPVPAARLYQRREPPMLIYVNDPEAASSSDDEGAFPQGPSRCQPPEETEENDISVMHWQQQQQQGDPERPDRRMEAADGVRGPVLEPIQTNAQRAGGDGPPPKSEASAGAVRGAAGRRGRPRGRGRGRGEPRRAQHPARGPAPSPAGQQAPRGSRAAGAAASPPRLRGRGASRGVPGGARDKRAGPSAARWDGAGRRAAATPSAGHSSPPQSSPATATSREQTIGRTSRVFDVPDSPAAPSTVYHDLRTPRRSEEWRREHDEQNFYDEADYDDALSSPRTLHHEPRTPADQSAYGSPAGAISSAGGLLPHPLASSFDEDPFLPLSTSTLSFESHTVSGRGRGELSRGRSRVDTLRRTAPPAFHVIGGTTGRAGHGSSIRPGIPRAPSSVGRTGAFATPASSDGGHWAAASRRPPFAPAAAWPENGMMASPQAPSPMDRAQVEPYAPSDGFSTPRGTWKSNHYDTLSVTPSPSTTVLSTGRQPPESSDPLRPAGGDGTGRVASLTEYSRTELGALADLVRGGGLVAALVRELAALCRLRSASEKSAELRADLERLLGVDGLLAGSADTARSAWAEAGANSAADTLAMLVAQLNLQQQGAGSGGVGTAGLRSTTDAAAVTSLSTLRTRRLSARSEADDDGYSSDGFESAPGSSRAATPGATAGRQSIFSRRSASAPPARASPDSSSPQQSAAQQRTTPGGGDASATTPGKACDESGSLRSSKVSGSMFASVDNVLADEGELAELTAFVYRGSSSDSSSRSGSGGSNTPGTNKEAEQLASIVAERPRSPSPDGSESAYSENFLRSSGGSSSGDEPSRKPDETATTTTAGGDPVANVGTASQDSPRASPQKQPPRTALPPVKITSMLSQSSMSTFMDSIMEEDDAEDAMRSEAPASRIGSLRRMPETFDDDDDMGVTLESFAQSSVVSDIDLSEEGSDDISEDSMASSAPSHPSSAASQSIASSNPSGSSSPTAAGGGRGFQRSSTMPAVQRSAASAPLMLSFSAEDPYARAQGRPGAPVLSAVRRSRR